jgi:tetratricopeptide (TPR) repeat protein
LQLLSQLYDALDQPEKAAQRWGALFESQQQNPAYVSMHVLRLLGQDKFDEADKWLKRLQQFAPQAFVTVELTARYHLAQQKYELIIQAITAYLDAENADTPRADRVSQAVRLYEVLLASAPANSGLAKQIADETDRLYAELVEARPTAAVAYARFAASRKRLDQALDLCERALPTSQRTQATATALGIVRAFGNDQQRERVARWLEENVAAEPDSLAALLQLADLRDLQQEYDEAMRHYRRILELDSQNVIALNNLAWLLAVRAGEHTEAERLIDAAIEASGPVAVLLDTQGTVRHSQGNFAGALESFDRSIREQDQPSTRFHRAQAHHAAGDADAARKDLQAALDAGLTADGLQPLERDAFRRLLAELKLPEPGT